MLIASMRSLMHHDSTKEILFLFIEVREEEICLKGLEKFVSVRGSIQNYIFNFSGKFIFCGKGFPL